MTEPSYFDNNPITGSEVDSLKRSWYSHVLVTLEKLSDSIEKVSTDLYKQKDEFRKALYDLREKIREETVDAATLERIESNIDSLLNKLDKRIADIEKNKNEVLNEKTISDVVDNIKLIRERLLKVEIKVAVYGIIGGLFGAGMMALFTWIIQKIITYFV